jgi:hypothetical protein
VTARDVRALARTVLDAVLAGDRQPLAVAHPLDFVCIPVLRSPGFGVCGHIWADGTAAATVHSHSWHLDSQVVAGAVTNEIFTVTEVPRGSHRLLLVDSAGPFDRLTPTGHEVDLARVRREHHRAGSSYRLPAGVFHRSTPVPEGPTLTLLSATTVDGAHDQVVAPARASETPPARRTRLPATAALDLTVLLRSAL